MRWIVLGNPKPHLKFLNDFNYDITFYLKGWDTSEVLKNTYHLNQIHSSIVYILDGESTVNLRDGDGFFVTLKNMPVAVKVADCLPIGIFDKQSRGFALIHGGWRGIKDNIVEKVFDLFHRKIRGFQPSDIFVVVGPSIRGCHYRVGPEFKHYFGKFVIEREDGGFYLDLFQVLSSKCIKFGVRPKDIFPPPFCTFEYPDYVFSYRRDGKVKGSNVMKAMML